MTAARRWPIDELYARSCAYRGLPRPAAPPLRPRARDARRALRHHPHARAPAAGQPRPRRRHGRARRPGRRAAASTSSGGTIPDRGYFHLRRRRLRRAPRRARRGVRLGALDRRHLHPRGAELADRTHHPQRRAGRRPIARAGGDGAVLAGRRARPLELPLRRRSARFLEAPNPTSTRPDAADRLAPSTRSSPAAAGELVRSLRRPAGRHRGAARTATGSWSSTRAADAGSEHRRISAPHRCGAAGSTGRSARPLATAWEVAARGARPRWCTTTTASPSPFPRDRLADDLLGLLVAAPGSRSCSAPASSDRASSARASARRPAAPCCCRAPASAAARRCGSTASGPRSCSTRSATATTSRW